MKGNTIKTLCLLLITLICSCSDKSTEPYYVEASDSPSSIPNARVGITVISTITSYYETETIWFGYEYGATAGIDPQFGEIEFPPIYYGSFDSRFTGSLLGQGVKNDYRAYVSETKKDTHVITFAQPAPFTLRWNIVDVLSICDSAVLRDEFGRRVNMVIFDSMLVSDIVTGRIFLYRYGQREGALPIEMGHMLMTVGDGFVVLDWVTLSETQNYGFEIQVNGESVGFVGGHGTTGQSYAWRYIIHGANSRTFLYRLKQIDLDGSVRYYYF